jgi:tRNA uridine 5-carbamoylmethylation protein Kti12
VIDLLAAYNAWVKMYVKASHDVLFTQNRSLKDVVLEDVMEKMMDRWQVPDLTEAHQVEHWVDGECLKPR